MNRDKQENAALNHCIVFREKKHKEAGTSEEVSGKKPGSEKFRPPLLNVTIQNEQAMS